MQTNELILKPAVIFAFMKTLPLLLLGLVFLYPVIWLRGIPKSDIIDTIREHVQEARQRNRIYEIS